MSAAMPTATSRATARGLRRVDLIGISLEG
jgi:hypothetical protein